MKTSQTIQQFEIQVKTKLEELQAVLQWFESLVFPSIPQKMGWQCEVALVEAFTNAVRHAHHNLPETTPIELEVEFFPNFLEMRIWDRGKPFDLNAKLKASELEVNSLEKEGGRGLQFIKKLTDELQYLNLPNRRNCLVMRKKYYEQATIERK
ncbi:ATP-binding protein [Myxosarcina sp. GI1]|uniref:ATP-binding protein n=1 Tax=Myxosarcina sp. GI1 TaxID=1541065 RepID=UPI0005632A47|nr:ATP-binding protein [Myxosarcina sp. GI1]